MKFRSTSVTFVAILMLLSFANVAGAQTIVNNLSLGSSGAEVATLQQILVSKGYLVMPAGVSYGYFGPLTKVATVRWQEANGIQPAHGYFGPISRTILSNQLISKEEKPVVTMTTSVEQQTPAPETSFAQGIRVNRTMLFRAYPFEVRADGEIVLDGSGFSKTVNKVYFNGSQSVTATSTDGVAMNVIVPTGLSNGEYELSVENVWGSSANPDIKIKIKVTDNPQPPPQITSASISDDVVNIVGTGFTSSNNLFTTFGDSLRPISSSGGDLSFRLSDLSRYEQIKGFTQGKYQATLWIFIQNEHGVNKDPYQLNITI